MPALTFGAAARDFMDAAVHPERWPAALAAVSGEVACVGAVLFSVDSRLARPPGTENLERVSEDYFAQNWGPLDVRFEAMPRLARYGVVTDQDFLTSERIAADPFYQDFLGRHGLHWFAGIGFKAKSSPLCLSFQRNAAQGPFQADEVQALKRLWRPLRDAASMSRILDQARVPAMVDALEVVAKGAVVCDQSGRVLGMNESARALVGTLYDARSRCLRFHDAASADRYSALLRDALRTEPKDEIGAPAAVVLDRLQRPLALRAMPLSGASRLMFLRGALLLLVRRPVVTLERILAERYRLTPAENGVANDMLGGATPAEIASRHAVKIATVRTHLKAIFSKTATKGQMPLVAWLRRLEKDLEG